MEPHPRPGFEQHFDGLPFEGLGVHAIIAVADVDRRSHRHQPVMDFLGHAADFGRAAVAAAQHGDDMRAGDHPAEIAEAFDQDGSRAFAGGGQRGGDSSRPAADHQHIDFIQHRNPARRLFDRCRGIVHGESPWIAASQRLAAKAMYSAFTLFAAVNAASRCRRMRRGGTAGTISSGRSRLSRRRPSRKRQSPWDCSLCHPRRRRSWPARRSSNPQPRR
ncbi:MAG: hypothetical protein BWZ10_02921 [candidate division BRC1 bacterium ADurb.BinA364]|nr:MAG: hypothetical protein BWZ10_02921 [candidate division BRC1 bacterium ADurb.BinA364]